MEKVSIGYFTHDHNARHDEKCQALINKYGVEGYGRFWILVEKMRETQGYKIKEKKYVLESLAGEMKCTTEELKKFINDCVNDFELFVRGDGFFYSESLLWRMSKLDAMREKKQKAALIMHERLGHNLTHEIQD